MMSENPKQKRNKESHWWVRISPGGTQCKRDPCSAVAQSSAAHHSRVNTRPLRGDTFPFFHFLFAFKANQLLYTPSQYSSDIQREKPKCLRQFLKFYFIGINKSFILRLYEAARLVWFSGS